MSENTSAANEHIGTMLSSVDVNVVSVLVPVRNGAATIAEQLEALSTQECVVNWELLVINNGSTDNTRAVVESWCDKMPMLRIIEAPDGIGINYARNAGVAASKGDVILICDSDDVVHAGWIQAHVDALAQVDISGGPLDELSLNSDTIAAVNRSGHMMTSLPVAGHYLPFAPGGNIGFHRRVWEGIGGFNEGWKRGSTETEFCWRAQLAGYTIGFAPGAVVAYRHSESIRQEIKRKYRSSRSLPRLYKQFGHIGMPRPPISVAAIDWLWLLVKAPKALVDRKVRLKWIDVMAWRSGLVAGSVKYHTVYFGLVVALL